MKFLLILFWYSISMAGGSNEISQRFVQAVNDEKKTAELLDLLSKQNPDPSQENYAYWGATETLMGKHSINPLTKLSWLDKGLEKINKSVLAQPSNPVPRYLRITVESQVPSFLGKSIHLNEDKKIILTQLKNLSSKKDCQKVKEIANSFLSMKIFNNSENELLREMITKCSTQ